MAVILRTMTLQVMLPGMPEAFRLAVAQGLIERHQLPVTIIEDHALSGQVCQKKADRRATGKWFDNEVELLGKERAVMADVGRFPTGPTDGRERRRACRLHRTTSLLNPKTLFTLHTHM